MGEAMTDLRKLLGAATKGPWTDTVLDNRYVCVIKGSDKRLVCESSWHSNSSRYPTQSGTESNFALIVAAVNALPALLTVCEAAQRWADARKAHVRYLMAYDDVGHREKDTTAEEINLAATALTAALAQWEKTQ
jgi:hypothetical protein